MIDYNTNNRLKDLESLKERPLGERIVVFIASVGVAMGATIMAGIEWWAI